MSNRKTGMVGNLDGWLVFLYLFLIIFGWLNIYSSSFTEESGGIFNLYTSHGKQLLWMGICLGTALIILLLDSRLFSAFSFFVFGGVVLLLILVLVIGQEVDGNKSWFVVTDSIKIQPSEFAKVGTALVISKLLSSTNFSFEPTSKSRSLIKSFDNIPILNATVDGFKAFGVVLLIAFLILLENDTGTTLVFLSFILSFFRFGLSWIYFVTGVLIVVIFFSSILIPSWVVFLSLLIIASLFYFFTSGPSGWKVLVAMFFVFLLAVLLPPIIAIISIVLTGLIYLFANRFIKGNIILALFIFLQIFGLGVKPIYDNVLKEHHRTRIMVLLGKEKDLKGSGWNVNNSKIAIGSGGFEGKGYMKGTLTKLKFVPKQRTDFIFSTVGEEWGFWGSSIIILIYLFFMIRLIVVAERQRSKFSMVYGYIVACVMFFHFFMNIGTTIGLAPAVGIPLPFFSYGGSSLLGFTLMLWVFIKLDSRNLEILR